MGAGRCGSCTAWNALRYATNYEVFHERVEALKDKDERTSQRNLIDVGSHLQMRVWEIQTVQPKFCLYLTRNQEDQITSLIENCEESLRAIYSARFFQPSERVDLREAAKFVINFSRKQFELIDGKRFPNSGFNKFVLNIDRVREFKWKLIWEAIGAEGSFDDSFDCWSRKYNSTDRRGIENY